MAKLKTTPHQLTLASSQIQDIYSSLEQEIFLMFVNRLQTKGVDADNIMRWQIEKLNELHLINDETIKLVSKATGIAKPALNDLFMSQGMSVYDSTINNIQAVKSSAVVNNTIDQVLKGYLDQTFLDLDNNVNQTLITTNYPNNPVMQTYQQIIKETTASVIAGSKTPERALADTIYKWRNKGITPVLIDKGGHEWSLEGYTRTVIDTTSNRAFQAVRNTAAADNGIDTFVMSSHAACRPACAPIQGKTVTTRSTGFTASESGEWFEPLDNHGYKEPGGTFGINCHHMMWPYIPGVNTNNQEQFDPQESMERYKWQQKQRGLERKVRESKRNEDLANQLEDDVGRMKYGLDKRKYQSALRKLVDDHNFLVRDYSREKVYSSSSNRRVSEYKEDIAKKSKQFSSLQQKFGKHGLPQTLEEYRQLMYNKHDRSVFHGYIDARRKGSIEPMYSYQDYNKKQNELYSNLVGLVTSDGAKITGFSKHTIDRSLGALHDGTHKEVKRVPILTDDIMNALQHGDFVSTKTINKYSNGRVNVVVNQQGRIITIIPRGE